MHKSRWRPSPYWQLEQRLTGAEVQLPLGWVAVKNRDSRVPQEESAGLNTASQEDVQWFKTNLPKCTQQSGIEALHRKIDRLLTSHMKKHWVHRAVQQFWIRAISIIIIISIIVIIVAPSLALTLTLT